MSKRVFWKARARHSHVEATVDSPSSRAGKHEEAAITLGVVLDREDKPGHHRQLSVLSVAMLYQHTFFEFTRAVTLYYRLVVEEAPDGADHMFSKADLLFLLARAYETWARRDPSSPAGVTAGRTARNLWKKLGHVVGPQLGHADGEAWIDAAATWRAAGDDVQLPFNTSGLEKSNARETLAMAVTYVAPGDGRSF